MKGEQRVTGASIFCSLKRLVVHSLVSRKERLNVCLLLGCPLGLSSPQVRFFRVSSSRCLAQAQFCKHVINKAGVAFVPGRIFFNPDDHQALVSSGDHKPASSNGDVSRKESRTVSHGNGIPSYYRYVRIAFCKKDETLVEAQTLLRNIGKLGE